METEFSRNVYHFPAGSFASSPRIMNLMYPVIPLVLLILVRELLSHPSRIYRITTCSALSPRPPDFTFTGVTDR